MKGPAILNPIHSCSRNLKGFWMCTDGAGNRLRDVTANAHPFNVTVWENGSWQGSPKGTALARSENTDANSGDWLNTKRTLTVMSHFVCTAITANQSPSLLRMSNLFFLRVDSAASGSFDNRASFGFYRGGLRQLLSTNINWSIREMNHAVGTLDAWKGIARFYRNGKFHQSVSFPKGELDAPSDDLRLKVTETFSGVQQYMRIYDGVPSENNILHIAHQPNAGMVHTAHRLTRLL